VGRKKIIGGFRLSCRVEEERNIKGAFPGATPTKRTNQGTEGQLENRVPFKKKSCIKGKFGDIKSWKKERSGGRLPGGEPRKRFSMETKRIIKMEFNLARREKNGNEESTSFTGENRPCLEKLGKKKALGKKTGKGKRPKIGYKMFFNPGTEWRRGSKKNPKSTKKLCKPWTGHRGSVKTG